MGYVDEVLDIVSKKNADQPEFLQAAGIFNSCSIQHDIF